MHYKGNFANEEKTKLSWKNIRFRTFQAQFQMNSSLANLKNSWQKEKNNRAHEKTRKTTREYLLQCLESTLCSNLK